MNFICDAANEYGVRLCIEANAQFNGSKITNDTALAS
jgi:hypothetical protein